MVKSRDAVGGAQNVRSGAPQRSNPDSLRHEIQALTDFLCSNKIEILNVVGPRESKEPGVYEWTLTMLRFSRMCCNFVVEPKDG